MRTHPARSSGVARRPWRARAVVVAVTIGVAAVAWAAATAAGSATSTFVPVADSYVDTSQPSVNFGTSTQVRADGSPVVRAYLRFNPQNLPGAVTKATLMIWANSAHSTGYSVYRVQDNTWGETTITAGNAPPPDANA